MHDAHGVENTVPTKRKIFKKTLLIHFAKIYKKLKFAETVSLLMTSAIADLMHVCVVGLNTCIVSSRASISTSFPIKVCKLLYSMIV